MIKYEDLNISVYTDDILSLLAEWDKEDCMENPSTFHVRESYVLNTQNHDPYTPTYMEALSGENLEEHFKVMDDELQSLMIRYTWDIVSRNSVTDHSMIPGTSFSNFKIKPDWNISKFKAQYFARGDIQKRLSPKPLNSYSPVA